MGLGKYAEKITRNTNLLMHSDVLSGAATDFIESSTTHRVVSWPKNISIEDKQSLSDFIVKHILKGFSLNNKFDPKNTNVFTFGSCFAVNIAHALSNSGIHVKNTLIEEDVNSTYANRYLLQYLVEGNCNETTDKIETIFGKKILSDIYDNLINSDIVIVTIGVAPCFFNKDGEFYFRGKSAEDKSILSVVKMRTTTVSENVDNIKTMIDYIHKIAPSAHIVLTLSPVPLAGTTELPSAILADCVSKSVLRVALHEVIESRQEVIYWPSFEIVKWISPNINFSLFGDDDQHSRHLSSWVINLIMDIFISKFFFTEENDTTN